ELVVDPAWFEGLRQQLPSLQAIEVRPRRGRQQNEITQFRYDVVLRFGETGEGMGMAPRWREWEKLEGVGRQCGGGGGGGRWWRIAGFPTSGWRGWRRSRRC